MNDQTPILEQFMEPEQVPFTPDAPGWYFVGGLILALLIVGVVLLVRNYRKNRYRRIAIKQLQEQETNLIEKKEYAGLVYFANRLMKDICVTKYDREKCAGLRSADWLRFLNETARSDIFKDEDATTVESIYSDKESLDKRAATDFTSKTKQWIKTHRHVVTHRT